MEVAHHRAKLRSRLDFGSCSTAPSHSLNPAIFKSGLLLRSHRSPRGGLQELNSLLQSRDSIPSGLKQLQSIFLHYRARADCSAVVSNNNLYFADSPRDPRSWLCRTTGSTGQAHSCPSTPREGWGCRNNAQRIWVGRRQERRAPECS